MGLSLNSTTHYNQWIGINALNIKPSSAAAVALRAKFAGRATLFTSDLRLVDAVAARANADNTGITTDKDAAKKATASLYGIITANCISFAIEANLSDLQIQMENATEAYIFAEKDTNFVAKCTELNTTLLAVIAANPVQAILFFTALDLSNAAAEALVFKSKMGVYKAAMGDARSAKKEFTKTWMPRMKAHVTYMTNLLAGAITTGFPAYAGAFELLLKLDNVGKRDQGLLPTMVDSVTNNPFALIAHFAPTNYPVIKKPKLGKSDASGGLKLMKLKVGLWIIKFSVPGYVDQIITIKIDSKKVVSITVKMVKVVVV